MSLYWYACISINNCYYGIYYILLEMIQWVPSNTSSIVQIYPAIYKIIANKTFIVTNSLISQLSVITYIYTDSPYL